MKPLNRTLDYVRIRHRHHLSTKLIIPSDASANVAFKSRITFDNPARSAALSLDSLASLVVLCLRLELVAAVVVVESCLAAREDEPAMLNVCYKVRSCYVLTEHKLLGHLKDVLRVFPSRRFSIHCLLA